MADLRMLGRRNLVCGLHVHVEVPDPEERIGLMSRLLPFLPVLLALSTSSPFWQGQATGMAGYRMRAYAELAPHRRPGAVLPTRPTTPTTST